MHFSTAKITDELLVYYIKGFCWEGLPQVHVQFNCNSTCISLMHTNSLEQVCIYFYIVLNWHCYKGYNFTAVSIYGTNVGHSKHHQLFILVNVQLMTKVVSMVRDWIGLACMLLLFYEHDDDQDLLLVVPAPLSVHQLKHLALLKDLSSSFNHKLVQPIHAIMKFQMYA